MRILRAAGELSPGSRPVCLAIGFFDGVHLGHQQILRQTISDAQRHEALSLAVTFDRHPNTIVAPQRVPPLIYSLPQKLRVIGSLGCDALLLIPFDKAFSQLPGETFIRGLARELGRIHSVCVGSSFTFGHKRGGDVALLRTLGAELNFIVHGLSAVALDGRIVSSTRIRAAIRAGELDAASQMLGRSYSLAGKVIHGDHLGQTIGFPTANLEVSGLALPPTGVYAVHALVGGVRHRALVNIGFRPTLKNPTPELRFEAHLLDYQGDLYGQEMEISFLHRLRDEQQFPSLAALREQLERDVAAARQRF